MKKNIKLSIAFLALMMPIAMSVKSYDNSQFQYNGTSIEVSNVFYEHEESVSFSKDGITYGSIYFNTESINLVTDMGEDNRLELEYTASINDDLKDQYAFFSDSGAFDIDTNALELTLRDSDDKKVGDTYVYNISDHPETKGNYFDNEITDTIIFTDSAIQLGETYHLEFDSIFVGDSIDGGNGFKCEADDLYFSIPEDLTYHDSNNFFESGYIYNYDNYKSVTYNEVEFGFSFTYDPSILTFNTQAIDVDITSGANSSTLSNVDVTSSDSVVEVTYASDREEFENNNKISQGNIEYDFDVKATNASGSSIVYGFENIKVNEEFDMSFNGSFNYDSKDFEDIIVIDETGHQIASAKFNVHNSQSFKNYTIDFHKMGNFTYDEESVDNFTITFTNTSTREDAIVYSTSIKSIDDNGGVFKFSSIDDDTFGQFVDGTYTFSISATLLSADTNTVFTATTVVIEDNEDQYTFFGKVEVPAEGGIKFTTILIIILAILLLVGIIALLIWVSYNKKWNAAAAAEEINVSKAKSGYQKMQKYFDWASSTTDAKIKKEVANNETTGAVNMRTIEVMDKLEEFMSKRTGINMIWRSLYKLPSSYYSTTTIANKAKFEKLCKDFDKIVEAKKKNHITSLDSILTFRVGLNEYAKMLESVLSDISKIKASEKESDTLKKFLYKRGNIVSEAKQFKSIL